MSSTNNERLFSLQMTGDQYGKEKICIFKKKQKLQLARYLSDPKVESVFNHFHVVFFEGLKLADQEGLPGLPDEGVVAPDLLNRDELEVCMGVAWQPEMHTHGELGVSLTGVGHCTNVSGTPPLSGLPRLTNVLGVVLDAFSV